MRTIALPGTNLAPSRLAFGSALLMGRLGRRESVRLLEVAHDSGITHFDTARLYGYGEAESALGAFISRRRDDVTVTTKLGIVPPRRSRALKVAKSVARVAVRRVPAARRMLRRGAESMVDAGRFDPSEARASLDTSLRELDTDHVDILLLHECTPRDLETEGLLDFLDAVVRDGKVRYLGTATDVDSTRVIAKAYPQAAGVVQVPNSAVEPRLDHVPGLSGRAVITHSAVGGALGTLVGLMRDGERCRTWSEALGVDCARPEVLGDLLLAYGLAANAEGVVLFASTSERHIRSNAGLCERPPFSPGQVREFGRLARDASQPAGE